MVPSGESPDGTGQRPVLPAGKERSMDDIAEEFIPTRKSLLDRLKNWGDDASWQDFFDTYWKLIYGEIGRASCRERV